MKSRIWTLAGIGLVAALRTADTAHPGIQAAASKPAAERGGAEAAEPDADSQIETWARYAMPGNAHKLLNRLIGHWDTLTTYRMNPEAEPVGAKGRCHRKWILGRRFVQEDLDGGNLVLPFQGLGLFGYDAFDHHYTCAWMDTTSTAMLSYHGAYDARDNTVHFAGAYGDPWTGVKKRCRGLMRFVDADRHVLELHVPDARGREYKLLEIIYTRRENAAGDSN